MDKNKEKHLVKLGYQITTDTQFQNKRYGIAPELAGQLEKLAFDAMDEKNKKIISKLTQLIVENPGVPMLKNYLSVAYNMQGNHIKAVEINEWILKEHPDYLFARLNKANTYIDHSEFEKVPEILGEQLEIKFFYPQREIFHLAEVTNYYKIVIRYFAAIENLELAENRLEVLQGIAPDHPDTDQAESFLFPLRLKNATACMAEERRLAITPHVTKKIPSLISKEPPEFNHPQVHKYLYSYGLEIAPEYLEEILKLPRTTLIEDLELILDDAVSRYSFFNDQGWEEDLNSFVLHSVFLLKEIDATGSLQKILELLEYDHNFLDFWFGDHITETLWQCIFVLGKNNTQILKKFLLTPGIDTYAKNSVSEALCQIVLHNPEKRAVVLNIYSEVFQSSISATPKDNLIDSAFLGLAIGDAIDCNLYELLPIIKTLYDKKYVDLGINGPFKDVEKEFSNSGKIDYKRSLHNMFELYEEVLSLWSGYKEEDSMHDYETSIPQKAISEKIGRNDPCPCGSGKKYKKCCIDKYDLD